MTISVKTPTTDQILEIADGFGMRLERSAAEALRGIMAGTLGSYARLDELVEPALPVRYPRTSGYRPRPEENPLNAWYWRCEIEGAAEGVLKGQRVAIKDNICVAGVPMANGSRVLEGYVPEIDATVVTRILDAGGTIAGKAACEDLCFSAGSHTCVTGPIRNPWAPDHSAGGSSGGSAALVASGVVECAMGGDQGGSIRTPSAWCGAYGLKPTWGLVPCTGAMPIAYALDHLGPICSSPENVARLLAAIAGPDPLDPRTAFSRPGDYLGALARGARGLRIGILKEGFAHPVSDPATSTKVRRAIEVLGGQGALVSEVSVPMHYDAPHVWTAVILEGATELMIKGNGQGNNWNGYYTVSLIDAFARGWRSRPDDLSATCKLVLLLGEYLNRHYHGRYHAKGQNLKPAVKAAYDAALEQVDILAMPTIPFPATRLPPEDCVLEDYIDLALNMQQNTCPFDVAGHPAFTLPCGLVDGRPIGLMLVGRHMDEATLIAAGQAYAQAVDWKTE
jgi:amidase